MRGFPICALYRIVLYGDNIMEDEMAGACSMRGKVRRIVMGNVMVICLFIYFGGRPILNCIQILSAYVTENVVRVRCLGI
jgi:hypothetical protein